MTEDQTVEPATVDRDVKPRSPWGLSVGLVSLALAFAIYVVGGVMLGVGIRLFDHGNYNHRFLEYTALGYQFLTFGVIVSAALFVLGRHALTPSSLGFRFPGWRTMALAALTVIPVLVLTAALQGLLNRLLPGAPVHGNAQDIFPSYAIHIVWWERILIVLFVAVQVPLTEEALFRGILYQGARTFFERWFPYRGAVAGAAVLSGTIFGGFHVLGDFRQIHTLPVLIVFGIVLAYVFERTDSIYASAIIHGLNNAVAILIVFFTTQ